MARGIVDFMRLSEKLKSELRHSWLSCGRRESVAEHSWQMALMAMLAHPHLEGEVDLFRALKMVIIHDLVEAEAGDVPYTEQTEAVRTVKAEKERAAIENIRDVLGPETGQDFYDLWHDFENLDSPEARFVKALDNLEVQIQHNLAALSTWEEKEYDMVYTKMDRHCAHDSFLRAVCEAVKIDAEAAMIAGGVDVAAVKRRVVA